MVKKSDSGASQKVQPRLAPEMHRYLEDLVETTFYGKTKTQVAQKLIELGIMEAIAKRHIDVRRKPKRKS
jgi:hypothetical protein